MKEQFDKNQKIKVIAMGIASIIIIGLSASLFFVNRDNINDKIKDKDTKTSSNISSTTPKKDDTEYVDTINMDIPDYKKEDNKYITSGFTIYENNLYADIVSDELLEEYKNKTTKINNGEGYLIQKDITNIFRVTKGEGEYNYLFAINDKGDLYYINNLVNSTSSKFKVTKITELKDIKEVSVKETMPMNAVAIDKDNKEHDLNDIIDKYAKLK